MAGHIRQHTSKVTSEKVCWWWTRVPLPSIPGEMEMGWTLAIDDKVNFAYTLLGQWSVLSGQSMKACRIGNDEP
jgi:hypothetical protein